MQVSYKRTRKVLHYYYVWYPFLILLNPLLTLKISWDAGLVPDTRSQDDQLGLHGRLDHHDDQNSGKQSLISSYKKNLYPVLISEINRNVQDPVLSSSSLRSKETPSIPNSSD